MSEKRTWTHGEELTCFCGMPACVVVGDGGPELFCFAHSKMEGLLAPLPDEPPENWPLEGAELLALLKAEYERREAEEDDGD